ncbi:hypothetical protein DY000_02055901 [Brassica cretica]|uniref:Wax synthase domain-containing protein n=1 Tax=Brassica cretica TaxID=69181 RepID=A0ABQ7AA50_BRACR|nr:hypothetical protein DY000_02055901 [Brassica cretica]
MSVLSILVHHLLHPSGDLTEMVSFISAWCLVIISLCYTHIVARLVSKGMRRMILFIPVFLYFFVVPLSLSNIHAVGITAFFISWLANFKLFLFALGRGPLASDSKPLLSLPIFLAVSCLPIKIHLSPKPTTSYSSREGLLYYTIMVTLLVLMTKVYAYNSKLPDKAVLTLYAIHIYLSLELILAATATMVRAMSSLELEPQFNKPYLATSLQEFWGRRWNLAVSGILRPTVYEPMVQLFSVLCPNWSQAPAVFATFVVSAVNKKVYGRWRFIPTGTSRVLTFGFVMGTGLWLFLPVFKRGNIFERILEEYAHAGAVSSASSFHGRFPSLAAPSSARVSLRWFIPTGTSRVLTFGFVMGTGLWLFLPVFKRGNIFERILEEYAHAGAVVSELKSIIASLILNT